MGVIDSDIIEFSEKAKVDVDVVIHISKGKSLRCKCGEFKKICNSKQAKYGIYLYSTCGMTKCNFNYGKKRPDHSKIMKDLIASGKSEKLNSVLMKKGELFNKDINTIKFKRKVLTNKGYIIDDVGDDDVLKLYHNEISKVRSGRKQKHKTIMTKYQKWDEYWKTLVNNSVGELTDEFLNNMADDEFSIAYKIVHGLNTLKNSETIKDNGDSWFKRITMRDLSYNTNGVKEVTTRSGWEASFIEVMESDKINWSFESIILLTLDGKSHYKPDLIIEINGGLVIVEVKGSFYNRDEKDYMKNKVGAGVKYAKENNMKFAMLYVEPTFNFENNLVYL